MAAFLGKRRRQPRLPVATKAALAGSLDAATYGRLGALGRGYFGHKPAAGKRGSDVEDMIADSCRSRRAILGLGLARLMFVPVYEMWSLRARTDGTVGPATHQYGETPEGL